MSVPVLDVCTGWGPVIHSANCSDSESISLSATMVKIQEGSGDAEKASRERKREKRKREKLASKAGAVHAGNAEITPPELSGMHSAGRASGKDSYDCGICAVLRSCPAVHPASGGGHQLLPLEGALHSAGSNPHLTESTQGRAGFVTRARGGGRARTATPIPTSDSRAHFFVSSQPLAHIPVFPSSLGTSTVPGTDARYY